TTVTYGDEPGLDFGTQWHVWCLDDTGANAPEKKRISESIPPTATTLRLTSAPSFTPTRIVAAAAAHNTVGTPGESQDGFAAEDMLVFVDDDGTYTANSVTDEGTRWA